MRIKTLVFLAALLPCVVSAGEADLTNYIAARTALLEKQVEHLRTAVDFMEQSSLSEQDVYELVGSPGFAAMDASLASHGFTVKTFYEYQSEQEDVIAQWLADHNESANRILQLEHERERLAREFERLSQAASQE